MNTKALSLITLTLSLGGCSFAPKFDSSYSEQFDGNHVVSQPKDSKDMIYWKKNINFASNYDKKIFLNSTELVTNLDGGSPDIESTAETRKIVDRFHSQLQRELLFAGYTLVDKPVPRSLALKVSIADMKRAPRDMSVLEYLPIGFIVGLGMQKTGFRDETLYLFFKTEVSDGMNGDTFGQAVNRVRGADLAPSASPAVKDLYPAIDAKARQIRERLDQEFKGDHALQATFN